MSLSATSTFGQDAPEEPDDRYRLDEKAMSTIVIFGATGDLASRKLIPAVYNLWRGGFLPKNTTVVGVARREKSDADYREDSCEALIKHSRHADGEKATCDDFLKGLFYHALDFGAEEDFSGLEKRLAALESERGLPGHRLYYLSVGPEFFEPIVARLGAGGLIHAADGDRTSRVVVEKPFGHDLDSARALNARIGEVLSEDQIFRIDHYLGKETVQNINAFRFGNSIFEPLFNQKYVDHVQITVAETAGMEGRRGAFYDGVGALRDVVQNHALQLLCHVAMEPPVAFRAKELRDEKVKVLQALELPESDATGSWVVRGQYTEGGGEPGYLSEEGVAADSNTETFVALKLLVNNWRWAGVPFFVRTGKRLETRLTEIAVQFKRPPTHFFKEMHTAVPQANVLVFRIQPNEAITLTFGAKPPGMRFEVRPVDMDFDYGHFAQDMPDAYERLLLDALRGESTLFMRSDEIENAWRICDDIMARWEGGQPPELYRPGSWGPGAANRLLDRCEGSWRKPTA